jgi:hypothetical protein
MQKRPDDYFDRSGRPLTLRRWATLRRDRSYRQVAVTEIAAGGVVHTVWFGFDQGDGVGSPLIFGTILRRPDGSFDERSERFASTEEDALACHSDLAATYSTSV